MMKGNSFLLFGIFIFFAGVAYSQESLSLDRAIDNTTNYLAGRLRTGSMIVVFGFDGPSKNLSDYVVDRIIDHLAIENGMKVVDRQNPDLIQREMEIQLSGNVGDEYIHSIGQQFGGDVIITGFIKQQGKKYQIRLQALDVQTAQVLSTRTEEVQMDSKLANLLGIRWSDPNNWKNQWLYFGLRAGGDIGFYNLDNHFSSRNANLENESTLSFTFAFQTSVQIFKMFALQTEILYLQDYGNITYKNFADGTIEKFSSNSLLIPVLAKLTLKPQIFSIEAFGGVYYSIPLGKMKYKEYTEWKNGGPQFYTNNETFNDTFGFIVGGTFGVKLGYGLIFSDIRYLSDFSDTKTKTQGHGTAKLYQRSKFQFGLGYSMGLIKK
ncbi:hypothetical protein AGMMS4952_18130 [Spirochaetia bacterium]|nr:hypothetical protein AGMMS4952_18130 [Spirochaetia bacterium]